MGDSMFFFIWILFIIILIIYSLQKSQKQKAAYKKKQDTPPTYTSSRSKAARRKTDTPKDDVLTRAKKSVAENFDNHTKDPDFSDPKKSVPFTPFTEQPESDDSGSLMQSVQDLIVKGYEPKLSFERDFIAEGMDLLNQYYQIEK